MYKDIFTKRELTFIEEWIENTKKSKFNEKICEEVIWALAILTKNKDAKLNLSKNVLEIVEILLNKDNKTTIQYALNVFEKNNDYACFIYEQKLKSLIAARERADKNE